ncbi:MAG: hypothetical protein ACTSYB_16270 [Candidatus Helarchaeota archaeon]
MTILYAIIAITIVSIPEFTLAEEVATYGILIPLLFIPLSYLYMAIKSSGVIRRKSFEIFLGIFLYAIGLLFLVQFIINGLASVLGADPTDLFYVMHIIAVGIRVAGGVVLCIGFK